MRILVAIPVFAVYNKNMNTDSRKVCANFKSKVCDYADNFMLKGDWFSRHYVEPFSCVSDTGALTDSCVLEIMCRGSRIGRALI